MGRKVLRHPDLTLIGKQIGWSKVISMLSQNGSRITWLLECVCGKQFKRKQEKIVGLSDIKCDSCRQKLPIDLSIIGCYRGESQVIEFIIDKTINKDEHIWNLKCRCGKLFIGHNNTVLENRPLSCGKCRLKTKSSYIELSGKIFNDIKVISYAGNNINAETFTTKNNRLWNCTCRCGKDFIAREVNLIKCADTFGCWDCICNYKLCKYNLEGKKFNRLFLVMRFVHGTKSNSKTSYGCICDCGNICKVDANNITSNNTKSCGCYGTEVRRNYSGEKHHNWITNLIRTSKKYYYNKIKKFSKLIYKRDNFICVFCNKKKRKLNAHHLDGWNWCEEKRFDINNCITLCSGIDGCHQKFHNLYGYGDNTREEFVQFCLLSGNIKLYNEIKILDKEIKIDGSVLCPVVRV